MNELRDQLRDHCPAGLITALITACVRLRPRTTQLGDPEQAIKHALRALARRYQQLTTEITDLTGELRALLTQACPQLLDRHRGRRGNRRATAHHPGRGPRPGPHRSSVRQQRSPAAFAALCGAAWTTTPVPASSGRTDRFRLSRGGDRQANRALHLIVCSRPVELSPHPR